MAKIEIRKCFFVPMQDELLDVLYSPFGKREKELVADWVGQDPDRLDVLWNMMATEPSPVCDRASWAFSAVFDRHPAFISQTAHRMAELLAAQPADAVRRNLVRSLAAISIPEDLWGPLYDQAFKVMISPLEPIAVRVHSMEICGRIALQVPELIQELQLAIEAGLPHGTAGFKSRGKKWVKRLAKAQRL